MEELINFSVTYIEIGAVLLQSDLVPMSSKELCYPRWLIPGIQSRELIPSVSVVRIGNNLDVLGKIEQRDAWTS